MKNQIARPTHTHNVDLRWGVSKAQDTYGYPLVSLNTPMGRVRSCGGGYDMIGTVVGDYLERLLTDEQKQKALDFKCYGIKKHGDTISIDGACGISCMIEIARFGGWYIQHLYSYDRKGYVKDTIGFQFTPIA